MNTELAFLEAIKASPDDDLPRLAFSDWLEEHGDPDRAHMTRFKYPPANEIWGMSKKAKKWRKLAREQMKTGVPKSVDIFVDSIEWQKQQKQVPYPDDWLSYAGLWISGDRLVVNVRHGFVSGVACRMRKLVRYLPKLVRLCPLTQAYPTCVYFDRRHEVTYVPLDEINSEETVIRRQYNEIPGCIWDRLTKPVNRDEGWVGDYRIYPNRHALFTDLSAALIAWAKSQSEGR